MSTKSQCEDATTALCALLPLGAVTVPTARLLWQYLDTWSSPHPFIAVTGSGDGILQGFVAGRLPSGTWDHKWLCVFHHFSIRHEIRNDRFELTTTHLAAAMSALEILKTAPESELKSRGQLLDQWGNRFSDVSTLHCACLFDVGQVGAEQRALDTVKYILSIAPELIREKIYSSHTCLMLASLSGGVSVIEHLLSIAPDLTQSDNISLEYAASRGHFAAVKALLRADPTLFVRCPGAMMLAGEAGCLDLVRYLDTFDPKALQPSRVVRVRSEYSKRSMPFTKYTLVQEDGSPPAEYKSLHMSSCLTVAATAGHAHVVKYYVQTSPQILQMKHVRNPVRDLTNAVMEAPADRERYDVTLQALVEVDPNQMTSASIGAAMEAGLHRTIAQCAATPALAEIINGMGPDSTPLREHAITCCRPKVAEALLAANPKYFDGVAPNVYERTLKTVCEESQTACEGDGAVAMLRLLDKLCPSLMAKDVTAHVVHLASNGDTAALRYLLTEHKDSAGTKEHPTLHCVCKAGHHRAAVELVLQLQPESIHERDAERRTCLHVAAGTKACKAENIGVLELLAATDASLLTAVDGHGKTPLHHAARSDVVERVQWLAERAPSTVSSVDDAGCTALHYACELGLYTTAKPLLRLSPDLASVMDKKKRSCLFFALQSEADSKEKYTKEKELKDHSLIVRDMFAATPPVVQSQTMEYARSNSHHWMVTLLCRCGVSLPDDGEKSHTRSNSGGAHRKSNPPGMPQGPSGSTTVGGKKSAPPKGH